MSKGSLGSGFKRLWGFVMPSPVIGTPYSHVMVVGSSFWHWGGHTPLSNCDGMIFVCLHANFDA